MEVKQKGSFATKSKNVNEVKENEFGTMNKKSVN